MRGTWPSATCGSASPPWPLAVGVAAFGFGRLPAWWLLLPVAAFVALAVAHARLLAAARTGQARRRVCRRRAGASGTPLAGSRRLGAGVPSGRAPLRRGPRHRRRRQPLRAALDGANDRRRGHPGRLAPRPGDAGRGARTPGGGPRSGRARCSFARISPCSAPRSAPAPIRRRWCAWARQPVATPPAWGPPLLGSAGRGERRRHRRSG